MDHDDNDFQSQNFQLGGEDNNNFPSSLRLFSLPKFELDDNLQIHLRFDGLVELESLLGIQDQVQNSWIEDFSPSNTALDLSSSAAESCSISMQKNVWSEATSSESVEMLLKSVGEDDMLNKRMDAIYSESHNELNNVSDHMASCYSHDDSFQSKEDKAVSSDPVPLPGQCKKDLSMLNKDASTVLPDVPDMSDTFNSEESESRIFEVLDEVSKGEKANNPGKVAEQCGLNEIFNSPSVESFAIKEKILDNSSRETNTGGNLNDEFVKMNDSSDHAAASASFVAEESKDTSIMDIDPIASSVTILANDVDDSRTQNFDRHATDSYDEEEFHVKSQTLEDGDHKVGSPTFMSASGLAMQPEGHTGENNSDSPKNPPSLEPKVESSALLMEGYNERGTSEEDGLSDNAAFQIKILSGGNEISGRIPAIGYEESQLVTENPINVDGHSVEVSNLANIQSAFVDSLEQAKEVSSDASVESKVSLKGHVVHDENLMSVKNTLVAGVCEGRQLEEPAITEDKKDACNHPAENKELAGPCTSSNTNCGMQEAAEKEDNNLGIHPPELTFHDPQSLGVQKISGDEVLENVGKILPDTVNGPGESVQEVEHSPSLCVEHSEKAQISPSQDARPLEKCDATVEPDRMSSDVHSTPLLPKKNCSVSSVSLDNMNPHMDVENLQDTLPQSQAKSIHILTGHVEGVPARVTTQVESGEVNFEETTLHSVGLPRSSSIPCSLEDGDCRRSSFESSCGSPIIISCTVPPDELHQQELKKGLSDPSLSLTGNLPEISRFNRGSEDDKYTNCEAKESNALEEDRSFTYEVGSLPDTARREAAGQGNLFSNTQPYELLQDGEGCPTTSGLKKANCKVLKETPGEIHLPAEVAKKSARIDKIKTISRCVPERLTASKRKSVKESLLANQADERDGNPCNTPVNKVSTMSRPMQLEEIQQHSCSEGGSVKPSSASSVQTSKLPESNAVMALFHQPFTDKQQVQLRAQIFVYGSLIQGLPPDEACMISAFGNADGEQSAWEGVWRIAVERLHSERSPTTNCVTLPHSLSGASTHEQISRSSSLQSKTHGTFVSQTSKGAPPVIFNSPVSLPSPVWCVSTPRDVLQSNVTKDSNEIFSPLHVSHSSHGKQYAGNGNPWLSQASQASSIPLVVSSQTSIVDGGAHFSKLPLAETFQVTPIRNTSVPYCSNMQLTMPSSSATAGVPLTLPAATTVQVEPMKRTEISEPEKPATTNQKTRRKKGVVPEVPSQLLPNSQPHTDPDSTTAASRLPPTMITMPTVSPVVSSAHFPIIGSHVNEQKAIVLEETSNKTVQAKLQAEDAAAVAAAAVRHSEGIWSQLSAQKNSGLVSEMEMKLAYAAVAAAAASSVAKAAAAAAKVASDAALQAKLMADEALASRKENSTQHSETVHIGGGTYLTGVTPILILKGKDRTSNSSSLIAAAKEAARKRVEAASAAAKHADNLDTIVKAAELTAVAVSQAGAIIAMGDPLPYTLSDLIETGPEGYRKVQHSTAGTRKEKQMDLDSADGLNKSLPHLHNTPVNENHTQKVTGKGDRSSAEELKQSIEGQTGAVAIPSNDISAPESEKDQTVANLKENIIQEGSLVEVLSNENGLRRVWYSANVLNLKDGEAYVCYNEHPNAGSDKLKEWIPLEGECDKPPRVRIAHPITAVKYERTRKRRRAAVGNYVWSIGDRVDAWVHDGWCEGIVTEKSKEDETKLTIHFPAVGDTLVVSVWHLRPSLIWKDGQWVEWSRPRENILSPHEGDTPQDKRRKLGRIETKNDNEVMNIGVNKHSANFLIDDSRKPEESRPLVLSEKDKMFSLGKSVREESNSDTLRIKRTGLQKEGSRVIFGIPKPGKKRKFMEVSKHYVKEKSDNVSEESDSIKFAKYLVPQSSRGWKNTKADPKGRRDSELKPKVLRSIKSQGMQTRSSAEGEGSFLSTMSTSNGVRTASHVENSEKNLQDSASVSNNFVAEKNRSESVSGIASSKRMMNFSVDLDVGTKGKVASSLEKANNEEKHSYLADHLGKTVPDAVEPRRSSRRIQPTSRLLEGLQSSMVTAKIPGLSHEKGARASHRNAPTSRGNIHV